MPEERTQAFTLTTPSLVQTPELFCYLGETFNTRALRARSASPFTTNTKAILMEANAIEIPIRNGTTQCVTFSTDGRHLVGGQRSGRLRKWKVESGKVYRPSAMNTGGNVYAVVASMNGRWIVSGDLRYKVVVWDAVTHKKAVEISDHTDYIYAVDVSSDSTRIASGSRDCTVRVFDIVSGKRVVPPLQHENSVVGVKFSPDGSRLATATYQYASIGIYDAHSGSKLFGIPIRVTSAPVTPLAWSSNGKQLFVATSGKITSFDISTSSRSEWSVHTSNENASIVTHGRFIAYSAGSSVSFWDHTSCQRIGSTVTHAIKVNCISISHDARYLACVKDNGITIHNLVGLLPDAYIHGPCISRIPLMEVTEAVLESWKGGDLTQTESMLSEEIAHCFRPSHHALAARALMRSHLSAWQPATEDAELSLKIKQSPIGHIARSLALLGAGKQELALDDFDFVFRENDPSDNTLLLVIKSILVFMCGKHEQAISRLRGVINASNGGQYTQVLGNMYLKQGDFENAVKTLADPKKPSHRLDLSPLTTISFIFNWNFDNLKALAWQRLCEALCAVGSIKEVGETLLKMVGPLPEDKRELAHGSVLQDIVMRTGQVTLLMWTGRSSVSNSCLPSSPAVYSRPPFVPPYLEREELKKRTDELRDVTPLGDAMMIYGRVTRLQPVRFTNFRLLLPCIVFDVTNIQIEQVNMYRAGTIGLGDVEFTTADSIPLKDPQRFVFADLRIHGFQESPDVSATSSEDMDVEMVYQLVIEEAPSTPSDAYTRALELIVHLGQPFSALLLMQQPDGAYKRVAADHQIVVRGMGSNVPRDVRVEVLEIL